MFCKQKNDVFFTLIEQHPAQVTKTYGCSRVKSNFSAANLNFLCTREEGTAPWTSSAWAIPLSHHQVFAGWSLGCLRLLQWYNYSHYKDYKYREKEMLHWKGTKTGFWLLSGCWMQRNAIKPVIANSTPLKDRMQLQQYYKQPQGSERTVGAICFWLVKMLHFGFGHISNFITTGLSL